MKEIVQIERIQQIEIDMLKDVDAFCKSNGIKYFVAYGTLIGAIRHKGFIPWDDDIDIVMPREDYELFLQTYGNDRYAVLSADNNADYYYTFAKVTDKKTYIVEEGRAQDIPDLGIYVDIFPWDGIPSDAGLHAKIFLSITHFWNRLAILSKLHSVAYYKGLINRFLFSIAHIISYKNIQKVCRWFSKKYTTESNEFAYTPCGTNTMAEIFRVRDFDELVRAPFEDIQVNIPKGYHEILKREYGDYMVLPPEEKRISNHNARFYFREEK